MSNSEKSSALLYVAFHYPPILGSSGVHRTLAFTRFLADEGWRVGVLSTSLKAYEKWDPSQKEFIPPKIELIRSFARDTARDLAFKGRYTKWMAMPDRWQNWIPSALFAGLRFIAKNKPKFIISTYPIATAHIIGFLLHKFTRIPWIADFRDPMAQDDYPSDKHRKKVFQWIEKKAVKHCSKIIFTCNGALEYYKTKFPEAPEELWAVIPNGYDEAVFANVTTSTEANNEDKVTLLHSGTIYPNERDPTEFFTALSELKKEKHSCIKKLSIKLRATGHDHLFQPVLDSMDIGDIVELLPSVPYSVALQEMMDVDALTLLQASNCNFQVPAKAYEYIRVKKPILALTDPIGDTAKVILQSGVAELAPLNDVVKIKQAIISFVEKIENDKFKFLSDEEIVNFSRQSQAHLLVNILDQLAEQSGVAVK